MMKGLPYLCGLFILLLPVTLLIWRGVKADTLEDIEMACQRVASSNEFAYRSTDKFCQNLIAKLVVNLWQSDTILQRRGVRSSKSEDENLRQLGEGDWSSLYGKSGGGGGSPLGNQANYVSAEKNFQPMRGKRLIPGADSFGPDNRYL